MSIEKGFLEEKHIRLAPIDQENDPPVEVSWTYDPCYLRMLDSKPAYPLSPEGLNGLECHSPAMHVYE